MVRAVVDHVLEDLPEGLGEGRAVRRLVVEGARELRRAQRRHERALLSLELVPLRAEISQARKVSITVELGWRGAFPAREPDAVGAVDVGEHALEGGKAPVPAKILPRRLLAERGGFREEGAVAPPVIVPDAADELELHGSSPIRGPRRYRLPGRSALPPP